MNPALVNFSSWLNLCRPIHEIFSSCYPKDDSELGEVNSVLWAAEKVQRIFRTWHGRRFFPHFVFLVYSNKGSVPSRLPGHNVNTVKSEFWMFHKILETYSAKMSLVLGKINAVHVLWLIKEVQRFAWVLVVALHWATCWISIFKTSIKLITCAECRDCRWLQEEFQLLN